MGQLPPTHMFVVLCPKIPQNTNFKYRFNATQGFLLSLCSFARKFTTTSLSNTGFMSPKAFSLGGYEKVAKGEGWGCSSGSSKYECVGFLKSTKQEKVSPSLSAVHMLRYGCVVQFAFLAYSCTPSVYNIQHKLQKSSPHCTRS